jgi:hypothetical protein
MGDTTITWEPDQDDDMEKIIEKKMAAGVTFYILPQRQPGQKGRVAKPKKLTASTMADARKHRALSIPDADFSKFVLDGKGTAMPTPCDLAEDKKSVIRAKTAKQVASGRSIGVQPRAGG